MSDAQEPNGLKRRSLLTGMTGILASGIAPHANIAFGDG